MRAVVAALVLAATGADAHPKGMHTRILFSVSKYAVDGLLVMDVDQGDRAKLLRDGCDANRNGVLEPEEAAVLKKKLVAMSMRALKVSISSAPVPMTVKESKMSLREDQRASDSGMSIAVILEGAHPHAVSPGMNLEVEDTTPDFSAAVIEVSALSGTDGGAQALDRTELGAGQTWKVRLGELQPR